MLKNVSVGLGVVLVIYGVIMGMMSALEAKFIFFPEYPSRRVVPPDPQWRLDHRRVELTAEDGIRLAGWLIPAEQNAEEWFVIFFHGNAGNIGDRVHRYAALKGLGASVLAVDYRGYGESEGSPDEPGLYLDALACHNYAVNILKVPASRIVLYGQSLGSAVAVDLAARVPHGAVVLEGAMTSVADRGQELYPFLPVKWMARNRFDSWAKIDAIRTPKLFIHAVFDEVIPYAHGRRLFEKAVEPKIFLDLRGGHNDCDIVDADRLYGGLRQFLSELSGSNRRYTP